ncbi:glucans biosynthesis glucosyltransferase MdoH [Coralloluteibacterium thermophilus]|uniref:Glucans biosynthesis glucosyltransferase H n=1 Tax=Coralloluteibacterium thermophilum TaxID=2707049 RepID=A0ABV9NMI0_9GAMM
MSDSSATDVARELRTRLAAAPDLAPVLAEDAAGRPRLATAPPLARASMAPSAWPLRTVWRAPFSDAGKPVMDSPDPRGRWQTAARLRRTALTLIVLLQTAWGIAAMAQALPYGGRQPLELGVLAMFGVLFLWVSAGFWSAIAGFFLTLVGGDGLSMSKAGHESGPIDPAARTAIVMPICNEDVARVFAGLRATYRSVAEAGVLEHFDFYVLSDTGNADARVAELEAWRRMCAELGAHGRLHYRWRRHHIKKKSGNVADFCRRWGRNYRYMVVLDADSIMTGDCLATLVRMMEARPNAGIIQSVPHPMGRDTFYARAQQFASRVYGPLFTAGLCFWQLGESHFWGHNAIIRVEPFMKHCALGRLSGRGFLSGEIMSHDFCEAALIRRAGWAVWIAYDLEGSYEELPPNLLDELGRDKRWAGGNLRNMRLFFTRGIFSAHRVMFLIGALAYVSSPLWLLFLAISTGMLAHQILAVPVYFTEPNQLYPEWPEWNATAAISLFTATMILLFAPKLLALLMVAFRRSREYGGRARLALSILVETVFAALLAPVRMLFHTQFVIATLLNIKGSWTSPARDDAATPWGTAIRRHLPHTAIGLAWMAFAIWLSPALALWLIPVAGALIVSIPISVLSSSARLGRTARRAGLFLIPEETRPPKELGWMREALDEAAQRPMPGFADAVEDPVVNAMHCAAAGARRRGLDAPERRLPDRVAQAAAAPLDGLPPRVRGELLGDPGALWHLHRLRRPLAQADAVPADAGR